jgi:hypothetical protein
MFNIAIEDKLEEIETPLEHLHCQPPKYHAQAAEGLARTSTKLLQLQHYKTKVMHSLQSHDPTSKTLFL